MPAWNRKKTVFLVIGLLAMAAGYILINTYFITREYIYGPPLLFIQNRYLAVDIYPHGYQSATVFTNNNIEGKSIAEDIAMLRPFLKKRNLRGVFFVIPDYKRSYSLDGSPEVLQELRLLQADGHEIAQNGTYYTYGPDLARGAPPGGELLKLTYDEQVERIDQGKNIMTRLGFPPAGFRAPDYLINRQTLRVLATSNFLYSSSTQAPPRTWNTLLRPSLTRGVIYPYHPDSFELLEFTDQGDPTLKYAKMLRLFHKIHFLKGVFVYHTYIGSVIQPERLQLLDKFIEEVRKENTWCGTLSEISQWWLAREKLRVETRKDGDLFLVTISNNSPFPLPSLGLHFLKFPYGVQKYRVQDGADRVLVEGKLPLQEKLTVNLRGNPES